jgi:2-succinyl-6-hydroxy-2,4-cyclohexadiene-1-carboxylate synthase
MIHALHGNAGLPEDLSGVLSCLNRPFKAWHLWRCLKERPECASLEGFASMLNDDATPGADILLGYSLGARLALHALVQRPGHWRAAILVSPHPGLQSEAEREARKLQDKTWAGRFLNEPWHEVMADWNAQPVLAGAAAGQHVNESWRRQVAEAFDGWSLSRQQDLRPMLHSVTCPVLWVTGAHDRKFTALAHEAWALLPRGRHAVIAEAGHRVHLDQPATLIAESEKLLGSLDRETEEELPGKRRRQDDIIGSQ